MTSTQPAAQPVPAGPPTIDAPAPTAAPQTDAQAEQVPSTETATSDAPTGAVAAAAASGVVRFYRVRANGTTRPLPYLAPGTTARAEAEYLRALVEDEGRSVAQVAAATGCARATVRRALAALALAEDVEAGDYDELVTDDVDAVFLAHDEEADQ